ncbi:dTDP-4-dehydrorhamnose 3,5-epimerase [Pseudoroseicyclus sp. CXY001]|uniref:dTDP-4-dehydrorhamnose 3,5-epimerase n=1 Tax=Pseudoroseicyclus sp. CXY001 TaxID=3242492 RepID=UPI00358DB07A
MQIDKTPLDGVIVLTPKRHGDARGYFVETYSRKVAGEAGLPMEFVQDNLSRSEAAGTLRGLHFQAPPHAQDKLVRCNAGALWDVAVDARAGSPSYGQWFGIELTPENGRQLFVPAGFLHGFVTLRPGTEIAYKCSDYYAPECDGAVRWDSLGIDWPLEGREPVLSGKDASAQPFEAFQTPFEVAK